MRGSRQEIWENMVGSFVVTHGKAERGGEAMDSDANLPTREVSGDAYFEGNHTEYPIGESERVRFELYGVRCRDCD